MFSLCGKQKSLSLALELVEEFQKIIITEGNTVTNKEVVTVTNLSYSFKGRFVTTQLLSIYENLIDLCLMEKQNATVDSADETYYANLAKSFHEEYHEKFYLKSRAFSTEMMTLNNNVKSESVLTQSQVVGRYYHRLLKLSAKLGNVPHAKKILRDLENVSAKLDKLVSLATSEDIKHNSCSKELDVDSSDNLDSCEVDDSIDVNNSDDIFAKVDSDESPATTAEQSPKASTKPNIQVKVNQNGIINQTSHQTRQLISAYTYSLLIQTCVKARDPDWALYLLERMEKEGVKGNDKVYTSLVGFCRTMKYSTSRSTSVDI